MEISVELNYNIGTLFVGAAAAPTIQNGTIIPNCKN